MSTNIKKSTRFPAIFPILLPLLVVLPLLSGCRTIRTSTTDNTAIEEALMATAADRALDDLDFGTDLPLLQERDLSIADGAGNAPNKDYVFDTLKDRVLMLGMAIDPKGKEKDAKKEKDKEAKKDSEQKDKDAEADAAEEASEKSEKEEKVPSATLRTRIAYAAIDDIKHFIGIPSIPLPIPLVGVLNTPEVALFRKETQYARTRFGLYVQDDETGRLLFREPRMRGESFYSKWTFLIFINFSTTDLDLPFGDDI